MFRGFFGKRPTEYIIPVYDDRLFSGLKKLIREKLGDIYEDSDPKNLFDIFDREARIDLCARPGARGLSAVSVQISDTEVFQFIPFLKISGDTQSQGGETVLISPIIKRIQQAALEVGKDIAKEYTGTEIDESEVTCKEDPYIPNVKIHAGTAQQMMSHLGIWETARQACVNRFQASSQSRDDGKGI